MHSVAAASAITAMASEAVTGSAGRYLPAKVVVVGVGGGWWVVVAVVVVAAVVVVVGSSTTATLATDPPRHTHAQMYANMHTHQ